eukprot:scaffold613_cov243-Pinguiococcus_pyrenoidosus.AAC.4
MSSFSDDDEDDDPDDEGLHLARWAGMYEEREDGVRIPMLVRRHPGIPLPQITHPFSKKPDPAAVPPVRGAAHYRRDGASAGRALASLAEDPEGHKSGRWQLSSMAVMVVGHGANGLHQLQNVVLGVVCVQDHAQPLLSCGHGRRTDRAYIKATRPQESSRLHREVVPRGAHRLNRRGAPLHSTEAATQLEAFDEEPYSFEHLASKLLTTFLDNLYGFAHRHHRVKAWRGGVDERPGIVDQKLLQPRLRRADRSVAAKGLPEGVHRAEKRRVSMHVLLHRNAFAMLTVQARSMGLVNDHGGAELMCNIKDLRAPEDTTP